MGLHVLYDLVKCKYYEEVGGIQYQGQWQYHDCCHKYYVHCYEKKICWFKVISWLLGRIKLIWIKKPRWQEPPKKK